MRARTLNLHTKEARVSEVGVNRRCGVNKVVLLHQVGDGAAVHAFAWATRAESSGATNQSLHDVKGRNITILPGHGFESESNVSLRALSPGSVLTSNVLGLLTDILVLRDTMKLTKALSNEINILAMALDATGDDEAFLRRDIVHHELLHDTCVNVGDIVLKAEAGHAEGLVAVSSSEEHILVVGEGIVLAQVVVQVMAFCVLGTGDVCSKNRSGLKSAVDHHLEHVSDVVFDAVALEVGLLLIVVHGHVTTGHLDHTIVDGLVSVLEGLQVGVLKGEEGA